MQYFIYLYQNIKFIQFFSTHFVDKFGGCANAIFTYNKAMPCCTVNPKAMLSSRPVLMRIY